MRFELIELTDKNEIYRTYEIYKHCMFMPTEERFFRKIDAFLNDNSVKILACVYENEVKGIIVISFIKQYEIEILGIAVDMSARHHGETVTRYKCKLVTQQLTVSVIKKQKLYKKSASR